ncbi:MAG: hypothetical protein JOZ77_12690 [Candidatus Eremiobacteraeota bacterium]|nr:hypothetical protein [Candidatus Eremiobacteraeota bacterium]
MLGRSLDTDLLLRHYAVAGPILERAFGKIPFVWSTLPAGFDGPTIFHGPLSVHTKPKGPIVDVPTASGLHRYPALSSERIEGLVRHGAVELYSWSPEPSDPTRVRFARILIEALPNADFRTLEAGLSAVEDVLSDGKIESLRVYDGGTGAALWIPFCDGPSYEEVRPWLHAQCAQAATRHPDLVTLQPNSHGGPPIHLHVQTNAVARFSVLPYSVRAAPDYPLAFAIAKENATNQHNGRPLNGRVCAANFAEWMERLGDPFVTQPARFYEQRFAEFRHESVAWPEPMPAQKSHGPIVNAAITVLQDGLSHSADEILTIAMKRGLLDAKTTVKYVYTSLIEYIARANGNGRKPAVVQNADRSFRINEPPDEWPAVSEEQPKECGPEIAALIERLHRTASGADANAFEEAVCDAFDKLGFAATHSGGQKAPDGYADALLGPLGYRVMIECKSGDEGTNDPSVFEAAKYKDAFGAQFSALVGRAFSGEIELVKELHNHGVSAWTVDDLETLLRIGANAFEMRPLFAPGFAADALDDVLWERHHGRAKRVRLIADAIVRTGRITQAGYSGASSEAPRITEDVAMVLVDQDLAANGSSATCTRADVRAAIEYLANPLVALVERDPTDGSVVVLATS